MEAAEFYRTELENNATLLFEKRKLPIVTVVAAVPFGSVYEPLRVRGIAHFIEHMAFKGTKTKTMHEIKESIEKVGGILNAFTAREMTAFWAKLPSKHIERGIDVISDIMLNPTFDAKELEKERGVILEEMKMYIDDPFRFTIDKAEELLYKKPFGIPIIGTKETLNNIKRKEMVETHYIYCPENMIISVVGNAEFKEVLQLVKEKFKHERTGTSLSNIKVELTNGNFIEKRKNINQASVVISFHAPTTKDRLRYAADAFNTILGSGMSSRLFNEIREKRGLAYRVKSFYSAERSYGNLMVYIGTMKEKIKEVKKIVLKEIKKMQNLKSSELEEAKEQMIGSYEVKNEESDSVACSLFEEELAGNAENFYKFPELVSAIKLDDVRKIAKIKNYSFAALMPA